MRKSVYTVGQVNAYIKDMFNQDFLLKHITVKGEVSGCKYHSSGHIYFTLKDETGALNCVLFRGSRGGLSFQMKDGMQVQVTGTMDVYVKSGTYQLYAQQIEQDGLGRLYEQFEKLKKELAEQGMFAEEYKQPIPRYINTLGVITAPTGAAVRDIINITSRRNPYVQIILYPAVVQGDEAPASIIEGLRVMEKINPDVIILGRGGGSIEDLWAFNEEAVAQAVFDCPIPVISAVGHETDFTITDYVADLRAPTPSAGAELAVFEYSRFESDILDYENTLFSLLERKLSLMKNHREQIVRTLDALSPFSRIRDRRMRQADYMDRLEMLWSQKLMSARQRLDIQIEQLKGLSPLDKLKSGFSYVEDAKGNNIRSIKNVSIGQTLTVRVTDGRIGTKIISLDREISTG
jgi:exodeoxyribonuclease VII large subunit